MSHCANQKANSFFKSDICGWSTKEKKNMFQTGWLLDNNAVLPKRNSPLFSIHFNLHQP